MSRDRILSELDTTLNRAKAKLEALDPESRDIYIQCTGIWAMYYRACFRESNLNPLAYLDNDKTKQGQKFNDTDIIAPEDDSSEIMQCVERLDDDESVSTYAKMIEIRMNPEVLNTGGGKIPLLTESILCVAAVHRSKCEGSVRRLRRVCRRYGRAIHLAS